ncbi:hypothetical protein M501DRAFT_987129 [Patellaria atrata CBS 101060]|uniref:Coenzyme Q-binding protein COQ10 START domain-containing protein n=1 Tax=Patellaria atrata CBS 101060 TaxID=1346257 RepID=A0A9P4S802_9PEZI|nr:hypothetical protein M501DRAFT_987129 [Patellaria atrata CBS 101060]
MRLPRSISGLLLLLSSLATSTPYTGPLTCLPSGTLMPTPSYPLTQTSNPIFTVCSTLSISPPQTQNCTHILTALQDFPRYPSWNSFARIDALSPPPLTVGSPILITSFGLFPAGLPSSTVELISFWSESWVARGRQDEGKMVYLTAWKLELPGVMKAEHASTVVDEGDGACRYMSWETYFGPGSVLVREGLGEGLEDGFESQGLELKAWVEGGNV